MKFVGSYIQDHFLGYSAGFEHFRIPHKFSPKGWGGFNRMLQNSPEFENCCDLDEACAEISKVLQIHCREENLN